MVGGILPTACNSLASLTAVFTLPNLVRLTLTAGWLPEWLCVQLFTQHRFVHLRCLELIAQEGSGDPLCPQTDAALLPLVKPVHFVVPGRAERQAARAAERPRLEFAHEEVSYGGHPLAISDNSALSFPALECLALPYVEYNRDEDIEHSGRVSDWMRAQLRRSYEFEVVEEWEAETETLGEVELLKRMA